jgi:hypothetical protein
VVVGLTAVGLFMAHGVGEPGMASIAVYRYRHAFTGLAGDDMIDGGCSKSVANSKERMR